MKSFVKHESMFLCDCGYEAVLVRQFQHNEYKDKVVVKVTPEPQIELAIFSQSCKCKKFWDQLRWIWNIITERQIWADQVILNADQMEALGKTLVSLATEIKENEKNSTDIRS